MNKIKTYSQEFLRWGSIVVFGGYGAWTFLTWGCSVVDGWNGNWLGVLISLICPGLIAIPCLIIAYICFRRQYRKLFLLLGVVGCFVIYFELLSLPGQLGLYEYLDHDMHNMGAGRRSEWLSFIALPALLVFLFVPIYLAAWFFRICNRLAYPNILSSTKPKTCATHWLVSLGVCLLVLPLLAMTLTFILIAESSPRPDTIVLIDNLLICGTASSMLGAVLMLLGLVIRRPIPEQTDGDQQLQRGRSDPRFGLGEKRG